MTIMYWRCKANLVLQVVQYQFQYRSVSTWQIQLMFMCAFADIHGVRGFLDVCEKCIYAMWITQWNPKKRKIKPNHRFRTLNRMVKYLKKKKKKNSLNDAKNPFVNLFINLITCINFFVLTRTRIQWNPFRLAE